MGAVALILILTFVVLLLLDVPIAVAITLASFAAILADGSDPTIVLAAKMANGVNSFALLAIPFFILSGHLMGQGGLARRLIDFAATLVGRLPGGLGYVNTLTCMLFGSISGSAAAAVSSVGGFMIPEMNRKGYNREFNVAVTTTAATTGLLIPPSNIMIVYSVAAGSVSIAAMFMAGLVPGLIAGLFIMVTAGVLSAINGYRGETLDMPRWKPIATVILAAGLLLGLLAVSKEWIPTQIQLGNQQLATYLVMCVVFFGLCACCFRTFRRAFPTLLLIVIVIGGILKGIFTATEAAAIAVVYSFLLSVIVYREIKLHHLPKILCDTGITTAVVMLLIGASSGMSWIMTMANIPQTVSAALLALSDNPILILLTINLILICVGTFMDMTPAVLIFTPIFLPVTLELGMHPVHFGIMMIANLSIGLCTPPVGTCLFIGCGVGQTSIAKVTKMMLPFFAAMIAALAVITYVPAASLWLPVETKQLKQSDVDQATFMHAQPATKPKTAMTSTAPTPKQINIFQVEAPDRVVSPYTGMTREHWKDAGLYMLEGAFSYVDSIEDSMVFPKQPGKSRNSRDAVSKMESMCRTLYIAAPLMKENPDLTINGIHLADYYRYHIVALCDPNSPTFIKDKANRKSWPGQALVEFGALSISLFGAPEVIWDPLSKAQQDALAAKMLSYADGPTVPSNWKFFNILSMSFLKSRGYEVNEPLMEEYLRKSLQHYRGDGWYNDNPCFDYYSMWAFQMYGILWAHYFGDEHYPEIAAEFKQNFREMLPNYPLMFGREGDMIMWGRSITYRFAATSPFPLTALLEDADVDWGWLRRISSGNLLQFLQHPDFMQDRVPTLGFYGPFEPAVQEYSTRGSVYWMGKIFVGLIIPEDHPFWTATETEGAWPTLDDGTANPRYFAGSNILQTNYTSIGGSEIRAWCHNKKTPEDHGRDSANYNKLAYHSSFPWQADGANGAASMSYRFLNADGAWGTPNLYSFRRYEGGVYYRDLALEENPAVKIRLAELPLANGMLRFDLNQSTAPVETRLGHYALPDLGMGITKSTRTVNGHSAHIISNGTHQLAMVTLQGWDALETLDCTGLHPEAEQSAVSNATHSFDPTTQSDKAYGTLLLFKPADSEWTEAELNPIQEIRKLGESESDGYQVTLSNGDRHIIKWNK